MEEAIAEATRLKDLANKCIPRKEWRTAVEGYSEGLNLLKEAGFSAKDSPDDVRVLAAALRCNRAFAFLKRDDFGLAEIDCSITIQLLAGIDSSKKLETKAIHRRAQARQGQNKAAPALEDWREVVKRKISPQVTKLARKEIEKLRKLAQKQAQQATSVAKATEEQTVARQKEEVDNLLASHNLEVPNIDCHLVPSFWYARWEWHTVDDNALSPGVCDTSSLFEDPGAGGDDEEEVKGDEPSLVELTASDVCTPALRQGLEKDKDFVIVPEAVWRRFLKWFGGDGGGEGQVTAVPVKRTMVVRRGESKPRLELYSSLLKAVHEVASGKTEIVSVRCYLGGKVENVKKAVCAHWLLGPTNVRLRRGDSRGEVLVDGVNLASAQLLNGEKVFLEVRLPNGSWPSESAAKATAPCDPTSGDDNASQLSAASSGGSSDLHDQSDGASGERNSSTSEPDTSDATVSSGFSSGSAKSAASSPSNSKDADPCGACFEPKGASLVCAKCHEVKYCSQDHQSAHWQYHKQICSKDSNRMERRGMSGLVNLGNTCYLSAAIHGLSHTPELAKYLLSNSFISDINFENPLGHKGVLVRSFAELLREMWFGSDPSVKAVSPHAFRRSLVKVKADFDGFMHHDAQEFLNFLLDGLHEDVNLILKKPYVQLPDSNGRPDREVAKEAWDAHLKRNQSRIVSLFQGQFKSTLLCPACDTTNVKFDPFLTVSLPLPGEERTFTIALHRQGGQRGQVFEVKVPITGAVADLKSALCRQVPSLEPHQILFVTITDKRIRKITRDGVAIDRLLTNARDSSEVVSLTACEVEYCTSAARQVHKVSQVRFALCCPTGANTREYFGTPFVHDFPRFSTTGKNLYSFVRQAMHRYCRDVSRVGFSLRHLKSMAKFEDNDEAVKINDRCTILVEWNPSECAELYDPVEGESLIDERNHDEDPGQHGDAISISKCFEGFTVSEKLESDNSWYCPKCKEHVCASKKLELWRLPEILVVMLKRFKQVGHAGFQRAKKLSTRVDFPLQGLDLSEYITEQEGVAPVYDLYAVANHFGDMGFGHYTAFVKKETEWFCFDDEKVSKVKNESQITSSAAYILFYRRRR